MLLSTGLAVPCQHFWDGSKTSRKVELEPLVSRPWGVYGTQHHSAEGNWFWIHLKFLQRSTGTMRKLRLGFHLLACVTSTFVFSCSSQCRNTVRVTIRHSLTEASGYHHASSNDLFPILSLFSYPLPPSVLLFNPRIQDPSIHPSIGVWSLPLIFPKTVVLPHRVQFSGMVHTASQSLQQGWVTVTYSNRLLWTFTHMPQFLVSLLHSLTALPEITSQINNLHPNSCLKGLFGERQR